MGDEDNGGDKNNGGDGSDGEWLFGMNVIENESDSHMY